MAKARMNIQQANKAVRATRATRELPRNLFISPHNSKGLKLTLASIVLAAGCLMPSQPLCAQNNAEYQQFRFAYKLMKKGDKHAGEAFDRYIEQYPDADKRGDALFFRALLYQREGKSFEAATLLNRIEKTHLMPMGSVNMLRGQVYLDEKHYEDALGFLEKVDESKLNAPRAATVNYLRGKAYQGAGNLPAAEKAFQACAALDSDVKGLALMELAQVQVNLGKIKPALATLDKCLELNDIKIEAKAARLAGDVSYKDGDYDLAVVYYDLVIRSHQTSSQFTKAILGSMWSHHGAGRYEVVLQKLNEYKELLEDAELGEAYYVAGASAALADQHELAIELLKEAQNRVGKGKLQEKTLYRLAYSQFEMGWMREMSQTVSKLKASYPNSLLLADTMFLMAVAEAEQGNIASGAAKLTEMVDKGEDHPLYHQAVLRRARLYEQNNELKAAAADYKTYVDTGSLENPAVLRAALRYADIKYQLEQYDEAKAVVQGILALRSSSDTNEKLEGSPTSEVLDSSMEQEALFRLMLIQIKQNENAQALATLDELEKTYPLHPYRAYGKYYRGLLLMSLGRQVESLQPLTEASNLEKLPDEYKTNSLHLLGIYYRQQQDDLAAFQTLQFIEGITGPQGLNDDELLWLAEYSNAQGMPQRALTCLDTLIARDDKVQGGEMAKALYIQGQILQDQGKLTKARESFEHVVALGKGYDLDARIQLAKVTAANGNPEKAIEELKELCSSEASEIAARSLLESSRFWRKIEQQKLLQGDAKGAHAAREEAARHLKRLVLLYPYPELEPLPQQGYLELASVTGIMGENEEAESYLAELVEKYPEGPYTTYAKALLSERGERLSESLTLASRLDNVDDRYLKARVKLLKGRLEQKR